MWEVTGGSVLKGESLVDGAKRELEEETGIKVNTNNLHLFYKSISGDSLYRGFVTFINLKDHVVTLQDSETIDYKWIPVSNFENLINSNIFVDRIKDRFMPNKDKFFQLISNKKE
jgi:8-oxo-dGTP pyrophosphatase MutT (NUDIX family)